MAQLEAVSSSDRIEERAVVEHHYGRPQHGYWESIVLSSVSLLRILFSPHLTFDDEKKTHLFTLKYIPLFCNLESL